MEDVWSFLRTLTGGAIGAALLGVLAYVTPWGSRLLEAFLARRLEGYRANLELTRAAVVAGHATISTAVAERYRRQAEAVDEAWALVLDARERFPFTGLLDLLTDEERRPGGLPKGHNLEESVKSLHDLTVEDLHAYAMVKGPSRHLRLHVGEALWLHVTSYRALLARILLAESNELGGPKPWREDEGCVTLLKQVCPHEAASIMSTGVSAFSSMLEAAELRFIALASDLLSGRDSSKGVVSDSLKLAAIVNDTNLNAQKPG